MESYDKIKKVLALGFMRFLDENRPKEKMCLSNGECADIEKAFSEKDWSKLDRYLCKYAESEDERVRMELIEYLRGDLDDITTDDTDRWISWLEKQKDAFENGRQLGIMQEQARQELEWTDEKQKEQKPAEWSEEDEKKIHFLSRLIEFQVKDGEYCFGEGSCAISKQEAIEMLQSIRPQPKQGWSDEDEKVYNNALDALYYKDLNNKDDVLSALKDLCDLISKKRKVIPQYSRWKPSDEQIKALGAAIVFHKNDPHIDMWRSLYDDLQKIR